MGAFTQMLTQNVGCVLPVKQTGLHANSYPRDMPEFNTCWRITARLREAKDAAWAGSFWYTEYVHAGAPLGSGRSEDRQQRHGSQTSVSELSCFATEPEGLEPTARRWEQSPRRGQLAQPAPRGGSCHPATASRSQQAAAGALQVCLSRRQTAYGRPWPPAGVAFSGRAAAASPGVHPRSGQRLQQGHGSGGGGSQIKIRQMSAGSRN